MCKYCEHWSARRKVQMRSTPPPNIDWMNELPVCSTVCNSATLVWGARRSDEIKPLGENSLHQHVKGLSDRVRRRHRNMLQAHTKVTSQHKKRFSIIFLLSRVVLCSGLGDQKLPAAPMIDLSRHSSSTYIDLLRSLVSVSASIWVCIIGELSQVQCYSSRQLVIITCKFEVVKSLILLLYLAEVIHVENPFKICVNVGI